MTQEQQPENRNYVQEALKEMSPEEMNNCMNILLNSDVNIATRFQNIQYQVVITKQGQELEQFKNGNIVSEAETIIHADG